MLQTRLGPGFSRITQPKPGRTRRASRICANLSSHAGRGDEPVLRIVEQRWWMREHRKVSPAQWNKPQVKTKSNSPDCQLGAEQGSYEDEDDES
nr:hypothetical protein [Microvirga massiliensis]